jgi:hypothetical protein
MSRQLARVLADRKSRVEAEAVLAGHAAAARVFQHDGLAIRSRAFHADTPPAYRF